MVQNGQSIALISRELCLSQICMSGISRFLSSALYTDPLLPMYDFPDCPLGIPVVQCEGDPCTGAMCPSHPGAECRANFCGSCKAEWFLNDQPITCNAGLCFHLESQGQRDCCRVPPPPPHPTPATSYYCYLLPIIPNFVAVLYVL